MAVSWRLSSADWARSRVSCGILPVITTGRVQPAIGPRREHELLMNATPDRWSPALTSVNFQLPTSLGVHWMVLNHTQKCEPDWKPHRWLPSVGWLPTRPWPKPQPRYPAALWAPDWLSVNDNSAEASVWTHQSDLTTKLKSSVLITGYSGCHFVPRYSTWAPNQSRCWVSLEHKAAAAGGLQRSPQKHKRDDSGWACFTSQKTHTPCMELQRHSFFNKAICTHEVLCILYVVTS